jgi:hypothetical protein
VTTSGTSAVEVDLFNAVNNATVVVHPGAKVSPGHSSAVP